MSLSSPFFCDTCGAANRPQAQFCRVCGQSLRIAPGSFSNTITGLLAPQVMLKQRYIVHGQVGRGGFGAVYKAADSEFGHRLVAIKEMSQSNLASQEIAEAIESFKNEALLLAGLTHPNLPRIYEQFMDNGRSYLVMDFIEGETLEHRLNKMSGKKLPIDTIFEIALQLCSVLEYLHSRQPPIIFRDLKPANVMLTPNGHVYLIDFGIARHFKPGQEKDTAALGSSGYAPPEQYGKSQTTLRADIYSLGATLHQLLTGDDPSESPFHFASLHLSDPTLAGLDTLVMSMVNVSPDKRPASMTIVRQELQRIATQYRLGENTALSSSLAHTLPPLPTKTFASTLPQNYQPPQASPTPRKRASKQTTPPPLYPQANTLYICLGHTSRVTAVAWSPDGKYLASASYDKTIFVWDGTNGKSFQTCTGHSARVNSITWSPDSKYLASASDDRTVRIWDAMTGALTFTYTHHNGAVATVAWSPDGKSIASAGEDKAVHIWDAQTHEQLKIYNEHTDKVLTLGWSPDGNYLASAGKDRVVRLWELTKTQPKRTLLRVLSELLVPQGLPKALNGYQGMIYALAWSPDSKRIATVSTDHYLYIRNVFSSTTISFFHESTLKNSLSWSPTGKHLAVGGNDKLVHVWNIADKKDVLTYYGHSNYVTTVAWSPDGSRIASAGVDRTIQVWQAK